MPLLEKYLLEIPTIFNYQVDVYDNQQQSYPNLSKAIHIMDTNGCLTGQTCDQDALDAHQFTKQYEDFIWENYHPKDHDTDSESIKAYTHIYIPTNIICKIEGGNLTHFGIKKSKQ